MKLTLIIILTLLAHLAQAQPRLELYANVHTIGVNIYLNATDDPEEDAVASMQYKRSDEAIWKQGFRVSRAQNDLRLSTCIFNATPNTSYDVQLQLTDASTPGLNITLTGQSTTREFKQQGGAARSLYVSPDGKSDAFDSLNSGSLRAGMFSARQSDEVVLLDGVYHVGGLSINNNIGPGTIRAAAGARPVLSGADATEHVWTLSAAPGEYMTTLSESGANVNCVITKAGRRLYPYSKREDLQTHKLSCILGKPQECGLDGLWRDPRPSTVIPFQVVNPLYRKLFVKFTDNSHPSGHDLSISVQHNALTISNSSSLRLQGLTFRYYGVSPYGTALILQNCSEVVVDSCTFEFNDRQISLVGASHHVSVMNSRFADDVDWDTYVSKATYEPYTPALCYGLTVPSLYPNNDRMMETGGIIFDWGFTGRGTIVYNCSFSGMMDGLKGVAPQRNDSLTSETDIYDGDISGSDDAIEFDGHAANVRMWNMYVRNGAISMAPSLSGPLYIVRNIITDVSISHATIEGNDTLVAFPGIPFKFATGDTARAGSVFLMHNTYVARGDGKGAGLDLRNPAFNKNVVVLNNVFVCGSGVAWSYRTYAEPTPENTMILECDYNTYYTSGETFGVRAGFGGSQNFSSLAALRTALPYEEHGMQLRPTFVNENQNDFRPAPSSPLIDAGIVIPGINDREFIGAAPDIGAYESSTISSVGDDRKTDDDDSVHGESFSADRTRIIRRGNEWLLIGVPVASETPWTLFDVRGRVLDRGCFRGLHFNPEAFFRNTIR
ncbi:MAG: hypothetical protein SGJ05_07960 [bacterium]|nr:hypothetical protein [bacterium]